MFSLRYKSYVYSILYKLEDRSKLSLSVRIYQAFIFNFSQSKVMNAATPVQLQCYFYDMGKTLIRGKHGNDAALLFHLQYLEREHTSEHNHTLTVSIHDVQLYVVAHTHTTAAEAAPCLLSLRGLSLTSHFTQTYHESWTCVWQCVFSVHSTIRLVSLYLLYLSCGHSPGSFVPHWDCDWITLFLWIQQDLFIKDCVLDVSRKIIHGEKLVCCTASAVLFLYRKSSLIWWWLLRWI